MSIFRNSDINTSILPSQQIIAYFLCETKSDAGKWVSFRKDSMYTQHFISIRTALAIKIGIDQPPKEQEEEKGKITKD